MAVRAVLIATVLGLAGFAPDATLPDRAAGADDSGRSMAQLLREDLGLRSDTAWIDQVSRLATDDPYGIPLTVEEATEIDRRVAIGVATEDLSFLTERPWFVGLWIDQHARGEVVLVVNGTPDISIDELQKLLPESASVRLQSVQYSSAQLNELRMDLERLIGSPDAYEQGFRALWIDPQQDRVRLSLADGATKALSVLGSRASSPLLAIEYEKLSSLVACTRTSCGNPIKGGIDLDGGTFGGHCTIGFRGRPTSGTPTGNYLITAGHCLGGWNWYHASQFLGNDYLKNYYNGTFVDYGIVKISPNTTLATTPSNLVFASSSTTFQAIASSYSESNMPAGNVICKAGLTTGYQCATISFTNVSRTVEPGITLYHQWVMSANSQQGDSGSPVFLGSSAGGIVSYSYLDEHDVWKTGYGTMAQIIARGWRPCYASTC